MKQDSVSFYKVKDEYMALQEDLDREKSKTRANLFSENNEPLMLKQFKKELDNSKKNRRKLEENKALTDNLSTSLIDEIENCKEIDIQIQQIKPLLLQQLNEVQLMITSQMIPFFQNLREDFIELKDFIENGLISGYQKDYSDFPLDTFYMPIHPRNLHKSFIDTFFSSESKKRLKPFFQEQKEEIKKLENKLNFSESMRELSDNFLSLENLENNLGLECQLSGYVEIIENILKIYLHERHLEDQRKWCLTDNSSDLFLLLNNFRKRIDAFVTWQLIVFLLEM